MRIAVPEGFFSRRYTIRDRLNGPALATVAMPGVTRKGSIVIGEAPYAFESLGWTGRTTRLWFEDVEVGAAEQPSAWRGDLVVSFAPGFSGDLGPFRIRREGMWRLRYLVEHADTGSLVGTIARAGQFRREIEIDLPDAVPFLAQVFLTTVVLLAIQRAQSAAV